MKDENVRVFGVKLFDLTGILFVLFLSSFGLPYLSTYGWLIVYGAPVMFVFGAFIVLPIEDFVRGDSGKRFFQRFLDRSGRFLRKRISSALAPHPQGDLKIKKVVLLLCVLLWPLSFPVECYDTLFGEPRRYKRRLEMEEQKRKEKLRSLKP